MAAAKFQLRLDEEELARWQVGARQLGYSSVSAMIRGLVQAALGDVDLDAPVPEPSPTTAPPWIVSSPPPASQGDDRRIAKRRTTMCEHRVPPESFCKRCD